VEVTQAGEETLVVDSGSASDDDGSATRRSSGSLQAMSRQRVGEGTMVGRYVVLERLGEGGMGVVVRAYDPKLRREIALKVMRPETGFDGAEAQARMLREAQALARLSHPNVVAVYDAEITEHGVCIAMEYVEGRTLRAWLRDEARRWPKVLEVVLAAARGLAAAHAAGVVHRDIKPANVLVGDDGRVRLTDFGLAREREDAPSLAGLPLDEHEPGPDDKDAPDSLEQLTEVGTVLGTLGYMAPEQHQRETTDARSDQYALCVMLWEALHDRRPFQGSNARMLLDAKRRGPPPRPSSSVPEWVHAVMARGLAVDPQTRWPSVDALADALASGEGRARRRRVFAGIGLAMCAVLVGALVHRWDRAQEVAACELAGQSIADVWNDASRNVLRKALVATGVSYADVTADKVMPWLDAQARAWQTARTEACLDADVHGTWDAELLERGLWCLDERRMEFEALVTELSRAESSSVDKAVKAAAGLGQVGACRQDDQLRRMSVPPLELRDQLREVRAALSRTGALQRTGAYDEGLAVAREALSRAEALAWPPLIAKAHLQVGELLDQAGDFAAAETALEAAYFEAGEADVHEVQMDAAKQLVLTVGYRLARHEDGLRWSRHAAVALQSLPDLAQMRRANHFNNLAIIHHVKGSYEEAKALFEQALALREEALDSDHPDVAATLSNLATIYISLGAYEDVKPLLERSLRIHERVLGPEHPDVGRNINNLAIVHYSTGSYEEAKALYERALAIKEKTLGLEHPDVALGLNNLALVHDATGAHEEAMRLHERALAINEKALGPEHPDVARSLHNLAGMHETKGSLDHAMRLYERALAIQEKALGPEHPDVAVTLDNLALVHHAGGSHAEARSLLERALAIQEAALGPEHPNVAFSLVGLGNVALAQHRASDAVPLVERAVRLREVGESLPDDLAAARFALARALWEADLQRSRAIAIAKQARDAYRDAGESHVTELAEVDTWLAKHDRAR
jgi:eukaryotic-like serine/threonine-protein kinase